MKRHLEQFERSIVLREISGHLLIHHEEIVAAYCHGSFLTDDFADIDLGILLYTDTERPLAYEISLEAELEKSAPFSVDIRVLNQAPVSFCQAVVRGKLIMDRDPDRRADFEARILKKYFDFAPYRRRYLAEVLNAPF